jgi:hypothetical protein
MSLRLQARDLPFRCALIACELAGPYCGNRAHAYPTNPSLWPLLGAGADFWYVGPVAAHVASRDFAI